jgi:serine/threonine-protein kinase
LWAGLSFVLQQLQSRTDLEASVPFAWAAIDVGLFTALVLLAQGPRDLLLTGYPLLIAASGLWFRVRLVSAMTVACLAVCIWLQLAGWLSSRQPGHYLGILIVVLLMTGGTMAFQVYRIRSLNRYFDRQANLKSSRPSTERAAGASV